jgi:geranylgeranyl reductase family protein
VNERPTILVVGAGPAGSAAAIVLARSGIEVAVVDRSRFPRDKCCGDGLTTGALRRLELLGLDPRKMASFTTVETLIASSPSGRVVRVPLNRSHGIYGAVARRVDLDAALVDLARAAGATVIEGDGVTAIAQSEHGSGVKVTTESGTTYEAAMVLAADGARSTIRKLLRERENHPASRAGSLAGRDAWFAYRQYASGVSERAAQELWVRFDSALLPGYGWSFPLGNGRANVGIGVPRQTGTSGRILRTAWNDTVASPFFTSLLGEGATLDDSVRAWPIPTGVRREDLTAWDGRVLFLGDAAATADPFTGEGIAQAIESGVLAAECARAESPDVAASKYVSAIGDALFAEQRISRAARALLSTPLGARAALRASVIHPRVTSGVGRLLYEEIPRTTLTSPRRWGVIKEVNPGAFVALGSS